MIYILAIDIDAMKTILNRHNERKYMDIRVLRYFLAVAREGSVTGAANFLHVSQPTLSRQIKDLEEELGVQLLVRSSHSVSVTPDGMLLRQRAEEIIDLMEKTRSEFDRTEEVISGDVHIGGGETQVMGYIGDILEEMRKEYPEVHFHLYSGNFEDVTERLDKGLIDFGVLIQPADLMKYDYVSLPKKDAWGVVMRKESPLAAKKTIRRKDLLKVPLILSRQAIMPTASKNDFRDWFGGSFDSLDIVTTFNLVYNAAIMVGKGIGYMVTIDGLTNTGKDSDLCFRLLEPRLEAGLDIVWKKYQVFSPAAAVFHEKIQEKFGTQGKSEK